MKVGPSPRIPFSRREHDQATESECIYLTPEGRQFLEHRIRLMEATVPELRAALDDRERSAEAIDAHQRAVRELDRLRSLVGTVRPLEDLPDDPETVELGDRVIIELAAGARESYTIVHALEAAAHGTYISVDSPLGRALLGSRVGETVTVSVAERSYRCTVCTARRDPGSRASAR